MILIKWEMPRLGSWKSKTYEQQLPSEQLSSFLEKYGFMINQSSSTQRIKALAVKIILPSSCICISEAGSMDDTLKM